MRYLSLIILIYILIAISGLLFVGVLMGSVYIKKNINNMNEQKWDAYFKSMDASSYLTRFWGLYSIALIIVATIGYFSFKIFNFANPILLAGLTILLGIIKMAYFFKKHKNRLIEQIIEIKAL